MAKINALPALPECPMPFVGMLFRRVSVVYREELPPRRRLRPYVLRPSGGAFKGEL